MTHICVGNLTSNGPDNGLSPGRRLAIIWTDAGILLIGPWGTNFSEILIGIHTFSFKKINLKMSSAKWRPFCLGLNVLKVASIHTSWMRLWQTGHLSSWHSIQYWLSNDAFYNRCKPLRVMDIDRNPKYGLVSNLSFWVNTGITFSVRLIHPLFTLISPLWWV